jgi:hypothetical protein
MILQKEWRFFRLGVMICLSLMGMWLYPYIKKNGNKSNPMTHFYTYLGCTPSSFIFPRKKRYRGAAGNGHWQYLYHKASSVCLKEKERQAKIFVTMMELLKEKDKHAPAFVPIHKTAKMLDERYNITEDEQAEIVKKYFPGELEGR